MTKPSDRYSRSYLTTDEVAILLVRDARIEDKVLIQVGLSLGCRVSEMSSLRVRNINGAVVKIRDEKKDEDRLCVLDPDTAALLKDYLTNHYKVPVGHTRDHQRLFYISAKTMNRRVKAAFEQVGVSSDVWPRWHTLRHTYIRVTLDAIKSPRVIQIVSEQTGDSPSTILTYYGIPSIEERLKAAEDNPIASGTPQNL